MNNRYLFRYGLTVGKEIRYNITTSGSFKLVGPAGEHTTPIKIDMIMCQKVESFDGEKGVVRITIEKAVTDCDIPKENMPEVGKSFTMEMDQLGNCRWIDGKASWAGAEHTMMIFPEPEVEIGSTWVQKMEETAGSGVPFYNRYRLNGRDRRNTDLINFASEVYSGHPDNPQSRSLGKGSFTFNLVDQWIQDSDVRIKYEYLIPVPDRPGVLLKAKTILNVDMERILE